MPFGAETRDPNLTVHPGKWSRSYPQHIQDAQVALLRESGRILAASADGALSVGWKTSALAAVNGQAMATRTGIALAEFVRPDLVRNFLYSNDEAGEFSRDKARAFRG